MLGTGMGDIGAAPVAKLRLGVRQRYASEVDGIAEGLIAAAVVHVVACTRSYIMPKPPRKMVLPVPVRIVGEADTRTPIVPVVLDQTGGGAVLADDANTVEIKYIAQLGEDGLGLARKPRRGSGCRRCASRC